MMGPASAVEVDGVWQSPRTLPRRWLLCALAISTGFAILVAVFSTNDLHRFWGTAAACGYGAATACVLIWKSSRGPDLAVLLALCGALLAPLAWMAVTNQQQPEVSVVARSAELLIHHGTPFEPDTALTSTTDPNAYDPYLPVMAVFGLPEALFGHNVLTDPRVWFGICFVAVFWLSMRFGRARDPLRWTFLVAGSPVIAFELAVGGTDVPMVAFLCLGFALLWDKRLFWAAGLALGIGAAMKATAWPGAVIAFVFIAATAGWRAAWRFAGVVAAVLVVCVGPFLVRDAKSLVVNTIEFPLGLTHVISAAASPLPGHLVAQTGHIGHEVVVGLLVAMVLAIGVSLLVRPPRTVLSATVRLVVTLTLMFLIAPSTRFGYFIYPGTLLIWVLVCQAGRSPGQAPCPSKEPELEAF